MPKREKIRQVIAHELIDQSENNLLYNLELLRKRGQEKDYLYKVADLILVAVESLIKGIDGESKTH